MKCAKYLLILIFLVSCRSRQLAVAEQADSVNVAYTQHTDSLRMDFTFRFDSLTYTLYDDSGTHVKSMVSIHKGAVTKIRSQTKCTSTNDSTAVGREVHREEVFVPPRSHHNIWIAAAMIAIILICLRLFFQKRVR